MEVFTPPPYREKRVAGRKPKLTFETQLTVGRKVATKELTYKEASKLFQVSEGVVGNCVRLYKKQGINSQKRETYKKTSKASKDYRHEAQIKELKLQIGDLFLENQMLKKILSGSLQIKKDSGSIITTENLAQYQKDAE